jgi:hypothetical protein
MILPEFNDIIEQNDQTAARLEHLDRLRELVGNVYPNKFARSNVSGAEDTITNLLGFAPVKEIIAEMAAVVAKLAERERPPAEIKDRLNAQLTQLEIHTADMVSRSVIGGGTAGGRTRGGARLGR